MSREDINKLAAWMMAQGYATGHGDAMENLLAELDWQVKERVGAEREACAKLMESQWDWVSKNAAAAAIRARGNT